MSTLKLSVFGMLFLSLALSACLARGDLGLATATPGSLPAATATEPPPATHTSVPATATQPEPTTTAVVPTATAEPAATAEPTAPAVPTAAPSPDPNQGVGDVLFSDPMDGTSGWHWGFSDDAATFGLSDDGQLSATMTTSQAWWRFSLGPDGLSAGDQQARVTARPAACAGDDEYGLIFRGADREAGGFDLYVFKLRCSGAASFEAILDGQTIPIVGWTASAAIQTGAPAENTLTVWMNAGEFRFYVNDQYLFSAQDDRLAAGYYGFYLFDRSDGGLSVNFDDLVTRQVTVAAN